MKRRDFIGYLFFGLVWAASAPAQAQKIPVVGLLHTASPDSITLQLDAFRGALAKAGYHEGKNIHIEYRWADGEYGRLGSLAAELVQLNPAVIAATGGSVAARAAKAATTKIPVLFIAGFDPVQEGLVASINRPGGNATGVGVYTAELGKKRLAMLQQLAPGREIFMLVNPDASSTYREIKDARNTASELNASLTVLEARTDSEIESVLTAAAALGPGALLVSADSFFTSRRKQIVALASRHALPACYPWPQYVEDGGLVSYGTDLNWAFGQIGTYAARILKGAVPNDLPVQLPLAFRTSINLKTANSLQLTIPPLFLVGADRVIE
jgi:putative ABC transport system substrate-binding protein